MPSYPSKALSVLAERAVETVDIIQLKDYCKGPDCYLRTSKPLKSLISKIRLLLADPVMQCWSERPAAAGACSLPEKAPPPVTAANMTCVKCDGSNITTIGVLSLRVRVSGLDSGFTV